MSYISSDIYNSSTNASDSLLFPRQVGGDKKGKRHTSSIVKAHCEKSSSIPSKFSTTLFDRSRISGFGSSANRFGTDISMQNDDPSPGPGNYNANVAFRDGIIDSSPSYSKKGYGNFCSQSERKTISVTQNKGPGPGNYGHHYNTISGITFPSVNSPLRQNTDNSYQMYTVPVPKKNHHIKQHHSANYNSHSKYLNQLSKEFKFEIDRNLGPGSYNEPHNMVKDSLIKNAGHN